MPDVLTTATDLHAFHEPGETHAQLVAFGPHGAYVYLADVPMPVVYAESDTLGVMVDGRRWIPCEPRPQHHPRPW